MRSHIPYEKKKKQEKQVQDTPHAIAETEKTKHFALKILKNEICTDVSLGGIINLLQHHHSEEQDPVIQKE